MEVWGGVSEKREWMMGEIKWCVHAVRAHVRGCVCVCMCAYERVTWQTGPVGLGPVAANLEFEMNKKHVCSIYYSTWRNQLFQ